MNPKYVILGLLLLILLLLPTTPAAAPAGYFTPSLDRSCMFKNCMCYYLLYEDTATDIWTGQCLDCATDLVTLDWPMAALDCSICTVALAVVEGICIYDSRNNDDWATGDNYCNGQNAMIQIGFMLQDKALPLSDADFLGQYIRDKEQDAIFKRLKDDDEINCWSGGISIPFINMEFPGHSLLSYAEPRIASPGEQVIVKTRLFNKGSGADMQGYKLPQSDMTPMEYARLQWKLPEDYVLDNDDCRLWKANVTHELWKLINEGTAQQEWVLVFSNKTEESFGGLWPSQFKDYRIPLSLEEGRYMYKLKAYINQWYKAGELEWEFSGSPPTHRNEWSNEELIEVIVSDEIPPDLQITEMRITPTYPMEG
ncbi:MAG: hypothetical protein JXB14_07355, partial [Candidatus Altiarchaeota archaeon]|nr:hypothetical protein [Candidatus Altiarchaeota archaeon]